MAENSPGFVMGAKQWRRSFTISTLLPFRGGLKLTLKQLESSAYYCFSPVILSVFICVK